MAPCRYAPARIMIIDDDVELCSLLRPFLAAEGFEAECCNSPADGVRAAQGGNYDLILLDVMMPDLDGGDVLALLRDDATLKDVPVVFLTATVSKEEVSSKKGTIAGRPFISKPFKVDVLISRIDELLGAGKPAGSPR
jgi:DNA-binding response OmpR family regulator